MPFNPFSVLTSKIFGAASILLLLALGVQTWRANHYHAKLDACAAGRAADRASYTAAQQEALRKAVAAKEAQEADYRAKAKEADYAKEQAVAAQHAADLRFIAAHRLPDKAAGGKAGPASTPANDNPAELPQDLSAVPVVVSGQDVQACSEWVGYGVSLRDWALSLAK